MREEVARMLKACAYSREADTSFRRQFVMRRPTGNRDQAQYHLTRIAQICGTSCEEYRSLAAALEQPPGTGLVY